jgi:hypothetical protein
MAHLADDTIVDRDVGRARGRARTVDHTSTPDNQIMHTTKRTGGPKVSEC